VCAEARAKGLPVAVEYVCEECFEYATREVGDLTKTGGQPEVLVLPEQFDGALIGSEIPTELGKIIDIAPICQERSSVWLLLNESGRLVRFDATNGKTEVAGVTNLPVEVSGTQFRGHALKQRLYASRNGEFAAVVNDYGRYGQVVDLRTGTITLTMDGGKYHPETVPFSFAFAEWQERVVVIHRAAWNRLDVSDAISGSKLTERNPTSYREGEKRPSHYLDYFHGALHLSPGGNYILDDGWVWHPVGIPVVWSLDRWLSENKWESEDGATRKEICAREYYWDHGIAWLDEQTLAIGGIGDDDSEMTDGARIFDITSTGKASPRWRSDWFWAREVSAFAGPAGRFFSDGSCLYSSTEAGLSKWDRTTGSRTGHVEKFHPTHQHTGAGELVQLVDGKLVRWRIA
jgi:hypothetical protein